MEKDSSSGTRDVSITNPTYDPQSLSSTKNEHESPQDQADHYEEDTDKRDQQGGKKLCFCIWIILGAVLVAVVVTLVVVFVVAFGGNLRLRGDNAGVTEGPWSGWSRCSVSCGSGQQNRTRICNNEKCQGIMTQEMQPCSISCQWTSWNNWSPCDKTCDGGERQRTRRCSNDQDNIATTNCIGQSTKTEVCADIPCQASWSSWSEWGVCDSTCGLGEQERTRSCTDPDSTGGVCSGESTESRDCNSMCATWSSWSQWSECDSMCGLGEQERTRSCTDPDSTGGVCTGQSTESRDCNSMCGWSMWSNWGNCDKSCGDGVRQRTRVCTNSDSNTVAYDLCAGQPQENELCSDWACPDCQQTCAVGVLNTACDACECETSSLTGFVHDAGNRPLSGVTIAYADRPYIPLVEMTDNTGRFSIAGVCATPTSIIATKELYGTVETLTTVTDATTSTIDIPMEKMELPLIMENPRNKMRAAGESVAFCCIASANTLVTKYEWFKNGDIIEENPSASTGTITITQLETSDSGSYRCRVSNNAGSVFSTQATLTVTETTSTGCNSGPTSNIVQLPSDCVQTATNDATYDAGACPNTLCRGSQTDQTQCSDTENFCCSVAETELVTITCSDYELPLVRVTACGCVECQVLPTRISGRAVGAESGLPLTLGNVLMGNEIVASTDFNGIFAFKISNQMMRISLTFQPNAGLNFNNLVETTRVVDVAVGSSIFLSVKMKTRPMPMVIQSNVENSISVAGEEFAPVGEIVIPPDSIFDANGDLYTGPVNVYLTNVDMRRESDRETAPGDFTTVDLGGSMDQLQSFGIFSLDVSGSEDQPLSIGGPVPMMIDPSVIPAVEDGVGSDGVSNVKLWKLNKNTGSWQEESPLIRTTVRRRRRQAVLFSGMLELSRGDVINIDRVSNDLCWAKVYPHQSDAFLPSEILGNVQFRILIEDTSMTNPYSQYFYGYSYPSVNHGGLGACVTVLCDQTNSGKFDSYISGELMGKYLTPVTMAAQTGVSNPSLLTDLSYAISSGSVNDAIKITANMIHVTGSMGPLYQYNDRNECFQADDHDHFQFYFNNALNLEVIIMNTQTTQYPVDTPSTDVYTRFAFYPLVPGAMSLPTDACFITLEVSSSNDIVRVKSSSYAGDPSLFLITDPSPIFYGSREVQVAIDSETRKAEVCLEYKCPGVVFDPSSASPFPGDDLETEVSIEVFDLNGNVLTCNVCRMTSGFTSVPSGSVPMCSTTISTSETKIKIPIIHLPNEGLFNQLPASKALDDPSTTSMHDLENCSVGGNGVALIITC